MSNRCRGLTASDRDGGIIDHHRDVPFTRDGDGIVLFSHSMDRIIPGWFDRHLSWRRPDPAQVETLLLPHRAEACMQRLPSGRSPTGKIVTPSTIGTGSVWPTGTGRYRKADA